MCFRSLFITGVVADTCMDIFFGLNRPEDTYIMGFANNTELPLRISNKDIFRKQNGDPATG